MLSLFRRSLRRPPGPLRRGEPTPAEAVVWSDERRQLVEAQRAPLREGDRNLALETSLWMLRLPPKLRPRALADAYPRVANRIARDWADSFMIEVCFEDLLIDRRGGRRGFPSPVLHELRRLHHFNRRYRPLIEKRMLCCPSVSGDDGPNVAGTSIPVLDDALAIDWEPTETIVVTERTLRRR